MRKIVRYIIIVVMVFAAGYLLIGITKRYRDKKEAEKRIQTLPETTFISMTGDTVSLHDFDPEKPMIIVYFHPECDHCHYEAREIGQNATVFNQCQLVMITFDDSLKRLENFCNKYHLWEVNNFEILLDPDNHFQKIFGKAMIPSVYIYNVNRELKKQFQGETKPEAIINEMAMTSYATKNHETSIPISSGQTSNINMMRVPSYTLENN